MYFFLFKKSELFYFCPPAYPIFQDKTDANQTINWLRPKFLGKIFQFEFLVMTAVQKNIFAYKLFLSLLNISDFNLFFMWQLQHSPSAPEKSLSPLS